MTSRIVKTAVILVLGFVLACQGVFTVTAGVGPLVAKSSCCCTGCDFKSCSTPACCVKPNAPSAPPAPAVPPSSSQHESQALAASVAALLTLPFHQADELSAAPFSLTWFAAVPIFQRDCSYLI